ncbi:MAG: hypothetical protein J6S85_21895 [Methanobrevibacter sp.]|nr:hypothetical protein [Methanobrevibacter sp.]
MSFDIETSSFYDNLIIKPENKRGLMYAWVFCIEDYPIIGRTWEDMLYLFDLVTEILELSIEKRIIVYVHNLGFDFQFFRPYFMFDRVFAMDMRDPLQAITEDGIEFRCSYKLSGYALAKVGEHLTRHTVRKMVGDLDYSKIRTPLTPLNKKERGYIEHDGLVVCAYIQEEIEDNGDITKIPLTKTGKVRNYCRNACLHSFKTHNRHDPKFYQYHRLMNRLTITSVLEYKMLRQVFMGGFTHGNHLHINEICYNVGSFDETSAYPYVMISQLYPMSKGEMITLKNKKEFEHNLEYYHAIFTVTFYNIDETFTYDHYISISKCIEKENVKADNGRLVSADKITILLTNIDYEIIKKTYKWERLTIRNFRRYKRGLLPRDFILSILDLYEKKTTLKGIEEQIIEYQNGKENLNGCYGMTVTDICRDEVVYTDYFEADRQESEAWRLETPDYAKMIDKYNKDKKRFLYYPWGIFVTAHARKIIWDAILNLKEDYRYSDTDSVKFVNLEKHKDYFINYNNRLLRRLKKIMNILNIPFEKCTPKTIKGEVKPIGVFEFEGLYQKFKYLGAKRYLYLSDDKIVLTVSGINKMSAVPYLLNLFKIPFEVNKDKKEIYVKNDENIDKVFNIFDDGLVIPKGHTGKQIHTYIDYETNGIVRDYLGNEYEYHELSAIHLEDTEYSLSMADEFLRYLLGVQVRI